MSSPNDSNLKPSQFVKNTNLVADAQSSSLPIQLTKGQRVIWTGQSMAPEAPLYNMALAFTIQGNIAPERFKLAFQQLVNKSDAMRTVFEESDGNVSQRVLDQLTYDFPILDFSNSNDPHQTVGDWTIQRCKRMLDLNKSTFDTALLKKSANEFVWYFNQHHVATDASSFGIIFGLLQDFYSSLEHDSQEKKPTEDADLTVPSFRNYVTFENKRQVKLAESTAWFQKKKPLLPARFYGNSKPASRTDTKRITLRLDRLKTDKVRSVAMQKGVRGISRHLSQFNIFATSMFAFLYRVTGQRTLALGTPAHNRSTPDFKRTIGMFIEVLPLSIEIESEETFDSLLKKVQIETTNFLRHARPGASDASYQRCFSSILNYITASFGPFCGMPMTSEWLHSGHCDRGHHLRLQVHDFDEQGDFVLHFDLNEEVFELERQTDVTQHFERLLDAFLDDRFQTIEGVDILSSREKHVQFETWNNPVKPAVADAPCQLAESVINQFEQQVAKSPAKIALICGSETCNYQELARRVDSLAIDLKRAGVGPGVFVAFCLFRSQAAVVAILAIQKSGAAFVPIDPLFPDQRIELILKDVASPVVLTQKQLLEKLPAEFKTVCIDELGVVDVSQTSQYDNSHSSSSLPQLSDNAYAIFTSGSTGKPKGVVVSHESLSNYIAWASSCYVESRQLTFPLFSPLSFDLTITSIFLPLVTGGTIVVYPESDSKADLAIMDVITENKVDIVKLTPSHWPLLKGMDMRKSKVKQLILGGEDLHCNVAHEIYTAFNGNVKIHNEYGPTEATVGCIVHTFDPLADVSGSVPIGRPIENMRAYVFNSELQSVPQGITGELCLAGTSLANGYLNQSSLTDEKFTTLPNDESERIYRTGDLARYRTDGTIEYHGRIDQQIKIRGVRVELGEIEACVRAYPKIESCVVEYLNSAQSLLDASHLKSEIKFCVRCGLASNYPDVKFDESETCNLCTSYDEYKESAETYFRPLEELEDLFGAAREKLSISGAFEDQESSYDCISLLSGGKDSTYMLGRLVDMGLNVLAFTLDNGYISVEAKSNINRVVKTLGVDHIYGSTPAMNEIFVDSLKRHANVCQGCFKTIYTLSLKLAKEKGIPFIVTGLSRGQFFETRLTEELFADGRPDLVQIDATILRARKEYHRIDDAVSQLLDVEELGQDQIFEQVQFLDFYRYCDVELDQMLVYLDQRLPWIRPSDTGRSTNCLINDVGIYVHKQERGFHNYALPYSWDVRVGHKQRDAALEELDDCIDEDNVHRILQEIGYEKGSATENEGRLVAYYVSKEPFSHSQLLAHARRLLPEYVLPTHFVHMNELPLTSNGKIDRSALPKVGGDRPELRETYVAPRSTVEKTIAKIWQEILRVDRVGVFDNFFDLGGDSISAIQIVAKANSSGMRLSPSMLFDTLTVEKLAAIAKAGTVNARQGTVSDEFELHPIQRWFLDSNAETPDSSQVFRAELSQDIDTSVFSTALEAVLNQHDALRSCFRFESGNWVGQITAETNSPSVLIHKLSANLKDSLYGEAIQELIQNLNSTLNITEGRLLAVAVVQQDSEPKEMIFVVHHLGIDASSWPILMEDLVNSYEGLLSGSHSQFQLPPKTSFVGDWSAAMKAQTAKESAAYEIEYWNSAFVPSANQIPLDFDDPLPNLVKFAVDEVQILDYATTQTLVEITNGKKRNLNDVLLSAFCLTIMKWTLRNSIQVDLEGHGRDPIEGLDISRTVGWFTSLYPVTIRLEQDAVQLEPGADCLESASNLLNSISTQMAKVPNKGRGFGAHRYLGCDNSFSNQVMRSESRILFNYLGSVERLLPPNSLLPACRGLELWRSPDSTRQHDLEINLVMSGGSLRTAWTYNSNRHRQSSIQRLANDFIANLTRFAEALPAESTTTVEQFPQANLDVSKFNKLSALMSKLDSKKESN